MYIIDNLRILFRSSRSGNSVIIILLLIIITVIIMLTSKSLIHFANSVAKVDSELPRMANMNS